MPFRFPFMPYNYNNFYYRRPVSQNLHPHTPINHINSYQNFINSSSLESNEKHSDESENTRSSETSECFFELFGLKLHFDDVLIICILFFLYTEQVHDAELFLCLILLLLS